MLVTVNISVDSVVTSWVTKWNSPSLHHDLINSQSNLG